MRRIGRMFWFIPLIVTWIKKQRIWITYWEQFLERRSAVAGFLLRLALSIVFIFVATLLTWMTLEQITKLQPDVTQ